MRDSADRFAVELSVLGQPVANRYSSLAKRSVSNCAPRHAHGGSHQCVGRSGEAAFDVVGPPLLIGRAEVGPEDS